MFSTLTQFIIIPCLNRAMSNMLCLWLSLICVSVAAAATVPRKHLVQQYLQNPAVQKFREYLQIDTSNKENIKYAVDFWKRQASELDLAVAVYRTAGEPICVLTWEGTDPLLPSIMLNSHMDVVYADPEEWTYPPFDAHVDENVDLYARGSQDTKDVAIQYLEAIRKLKQDNVTLARTIHLTLMPDEETGGYNGMRPFVETEQFRALNVGFALDEGSSSTGNTYYALNQDKRPWQMIITVRGSSAHGSTMPSDSVMEHLRKVIEAITEYRNSQVAIMKTEGVKINSTYSNLNINMLKGSTMVNVVPGEMSLAVDMRLSSLANAKEIQAVVDSWVAAGGNGTKIEFIRKFDTAPKTSVDDSNPFWVAMKSAANELGINLATELCPATSDMMYVRSKGIPALGFSTKIHTTSRMHAANEYQNLATFLKGIDVYAAIIRNLGNTP